MPIYEYRCASCGHELEALQKFSDAPLADCPACHEAHLKKKVSAAGFHLKGSGWYVTDFRNSGAKPPAKDAAAKRWRDQGRRESQRRRWQAGSEIGRWRRGRVLACRNHAGTSVDGRERSEARVDDVQ